MSKHIVIATGGTGGHIYPALTFAKFLMKEQKDIQVTFVGSNQRMESTIIAENGYSFYGLDLVVPNGNILHKAHAALSLFKATKKMEKYFKYNPCDLVVGFGNYIEYPVIHAAMKFNIPYILHEQNAILGKANKMFAKNCACMMLSYPTNEKLECKIEVTGNPRSSEAICELSNPKKTYKDYGFTFDYPMVTIVMGSLGSSSVNALLAQCIDLFAKRNINYLIVTGNNGLEAFKDCNVTSNIQLVEKVNGIEAFHASNLVVSRAGASACAELFALGKPSILIPSPYVPNDHQTKNALAALNVKACYLLRETDANALLLDQTIFDLMNNLDLLDKMKQACQKITICDSVERMIQIALKEMK